MRIGILGPSSEIGILLSQKLHAANHVVIPIGRSNRYSDPRHIYFDLENPTFINISELDAVCLIAWIQKPRSDKTASQNKSGYRFFIDLCRSTSTRVVFISSMVASSTSQSVFARSKFNVESMLSSTDLVLRLGQVRSEINKVTGVGARSSGRLLKAQRFLKTDSELLVPVVSAKRVVETVENALIEGTVGVVSVVDFLEPVFASNRSANFFKIRIPLKLIDRLFQIYAKLFGTIGTTMRDQFLALYSIQEDLRTTQFFQN